MKRLISISILLCFFIITVSCSSQAPVPTQPAPVTPSPSTPSTQSPGETIKSGILTPEQIDSSMVDQIVEVKGEVVFIDKGPDGLFVGIFGGGKKPLLFMRRDKGLFSR